MMNPVRIPFEAALVSGTEAGPSGIAVADRAEPEGVPGESRANTVCYTRKRSAAETSLQPVDQPSTQEDIYLPTGEAMTRLNGQILRHAPHRKLGA
jgi:hypothetical protein